MKTKVILPIISLFAVASCGGGGSSGGGGGTSVARAQCYVFDPGGADNSFDWPGGTGSERIEVHTDSSCSRPSGRLLTVVVADSDSQALDRCPDRFNSVVITEDTAPELNDPNDFFVCQT